MPNSGLIHEQTRGVYIISITPFSEDGSIDFKSVDSLVEFFLEKGVTGITILGMMGEAHKLSANESRGFVKHVLKPVNERVPVLAGVSRPGLTNIVNLSRLSMDAACLRMGDGGSGNRIEHGSEALRLLCAGDGGSRCERTSLLPGLSPVDGS